MLRVSRRGFDMAAKSPITDAAAAMDSALSRVVSTAICFSPTAVRAEQGRALHGEALLPFCVATLRIAWQPIVWDRLPRRGVGHELPDARPDPGVAVERPDANADRITVVGVSAK